MFFFSFSKILNQFLWVLEKVYNMIFTGPSESSMESVLMVCCDICLETVSSGFGVAVLGTWGMGTVVSTTSRMFWFSQCNDAKWTVSCFAIWAADAYKLKY